MNLLPDDAFANVVQYMGVNDRFASCRVNKRFRSQIYRLKIPFQVLFPSKASSEIGPLIEHACVDFDSLKDDTPPLTHLTHVRYLDLEAQDCPDECYHDERDAFPWGRVIFENNQQTLERVYIDPKACVYVRPFKWFEGLTFPKMTFLYVTISEHWKAVQLKHLKKLVEGIQACFPDLEEIVLQFYDWDRWVHEEIDIGCHPFIKEVDWPKEAEDLVEALFGERETSFEVTVKHQNGDFLL